MDDALRHQQQLQLCKQLHLLQQQLCEQTQLSDELLASLYALSKFCGTPSCCLVQVAVEFPEFAAKLQRSYKPHPLRDLHVEQMEGEAVEAVISNAEQLAVILKPMYKELQALGKFVRDAAAVLADLHQLLIPVTMATAPLVIEYIMTLVCNTTRIVLLMDKVPWRLLVQVYTIVTTAVDGSSPQGRTAIVELLEKLQEPVQYLQELFQPISSRVSQILELVVNPVLDHVASTKVLECSPAFDVTRLGNTQLGITGLSLPRTYSFLQRLEDFRSWAQLGFLACPAALRGVNAQALMSALLQESFLLPVFGDVMMPLHALYQQHVAPALGQIVTAMLQGRSSAEVQKQVAEAGQLVVRCHQAAVQGADAEHAARRRHICRVLQELLLHLQDEAWKLPEALSMALAAQAYAKSELLWYFRHVGEQLPAATAAASGASAANKLALPLLATQPVGPHIAEDGYVITLVAAMTSMYDFLEEHQGVLQGYQVATMQALLEQQVLPGTAAVLAATSMDPQHVLKPGKDLVVPHVLVPLVKLVVQSLSELAGVKFKMQASSKSAAGGTLAQQDAETEQYALMAAGEQTENDPICMKAAAEVLEHTRCSVGASTNAAPPAVAVLVRVQHDMAYLSMLLSSRNLWMRPAVLEAPAQDPQYLEAIHKLLDLCPYAQSFLPALECSCSLDHLVQYQAKLLQLQQGVLQGTSVATREQLVGIPSLIKVLHWFEYNLPVPAADGDGQRDYAAEAKQLACHLLEEQCGTVALFLAEMAQELQTGLYAVQSAQQLPDKPSKPNTFSDAGIGDTSALQDVDGVCITGPPGTTAAVAVAGGTAPASIRCRAIALAHALDSLGPVRVSSDRVVIPVEFLRAALQQCLLLQVNDMVLNTQVPPIPSQLIRWLHDLLWASAELHQVLGVDVRPELWQVLLNHAQPDWVVPPSCLRTADPSGLPLQTASSELEAAALPHMGVARTPTDPIDDRVGFSGSGIPMQLHSMVLAYGEWYMQHVVRDVKGLGVMYAPQLRRFTAVAGQVELVQQRASLPELTALLQMFGPYAAIKLAEMSETLVVDCLSQLDSCLTRWKEVLGPITMAVVRDDSCVDAVSVACAGLSDEGQVLSQVRQLSRCLAFRQLLGEALTEALNTNLPVISATVDAVASNAATDTAVGGWGSCRAYSCSASGVVAGRHVCDLFELPRPGLQGVSSPVVADPVVVNTLVGSNSFERYKAWFNLPSLLGLCLNSPTISATSLDVAGHSMANELHALVHAAKCLALAQQQAADKVLTCGSRFLHPEADHQAGDMLACFAKVAVTALYYRHDDVRVRTYKQLILESLPCPQLTASQLTAAWVPASRIRSALSQAVL